MTEPETPEQGHSHPSPDPHGEAAAVQTYFPEAEWQAFRADDATAARYIVGLMFGIFVIGLILYTGVALWVSARGT
jgi:hypothetical protein